jgi:hypothetical protein
MHHDQKGTIPREPSLAEPRTPCRPTTVPGSRPFHGWGPKIG